MDELMRIMAVIAAKVLEGCFIVSLALALINSFFSEIGVEGSGRHATAFWILTVLTAVGAIIFESIAKDKREY